MATKKQERDAFEEEERDEAQVLTAKEEKRRQEAKRHEAREVTLTPEEIARIRGINAAFCASLPPEAVSSGRFEPAACDTDDRLEPATRSVAGALKDKFQAPGVPRGTYRVGGSDWLISIDGEEAQLFERAPPDLDPATVIAVP